AHFSRRGTVAIPPDSGDRPGNPVFPGNGQRLAGATGAGPVFPRTLSSSYDPRAARFGPGGCRTLPDPGLGPRAVRNAGAKRERICRHLANPSSEKNPSHLHQSGTGTAPPFSLFGGGICFTSGPFSLIFGLTAPPSLLQAERKKARKGTANRRKK